MYRFTIYNDKLAEVQTVRADHALAEGVLIAFSTGGEMEMIYHLPAGYSITQELV